MSVIARIWPYLTIFLLLCVLAYGAFWLYLGWQITRGVHVAQVVLANEGLVWSGDISSVSGFPAAPYLTGRGALRGDDLHIRVPFWRIEGFPLSGQTLTLSLPEGIARLVPEDPAGLFVLDAARVRLIAPHGMPARLEEADLVRWQARGGTVLVPDLAVIKDSLMLSGRGEMSLDSMLQPRAVFDVHVQGHADFLDSLGQAGLIDKTRTAVLSGIFSLAAKPDPETGQPTLRVQVTLEAGALKVAGIQVASLSPVVWSGADTHILLAPPQ